MLRRSSRLESTGYYDSDGEPYISYKETLYRIFRRRSSSRSWTRRGKTTSQMKGNSNRHGNRTSNSNSNRNDISNSNRNDNSNRNNISHSNRNDISNSNRNDNSNRNNISHSNSNRNDNSNSRGPTMFSLKILGLLFFIIPLCFGLTYLIPTLSSNFLDSGPSESPVSPTITNTDLNAGCEEMAKHLRELQDELLRLKKKMNYLLPAADTLPNFALESQGARVLFQLSSETYRTKAEAGLMCFGMPISQPPVNIKTVIQGHSPLAPGRCWAFAGGRGHLFIALSHPTTISHVTLGHISKNLSPTGTISSAPKEFSVYGLKTLDDEGTQLGTFLYDQDGDAVQTFKLPEHKKGVFNYVKLQVESNWGHPDYTCLYSFRVHGELAD